MTLAKQESPIDPTTQDALNEWALNGNLAALTKPQRVAIYRTRCSVMGLEVSSHPLDYISYTPRKRTDDGRWVDGEPVVSLYVNAVGAAQLAAQHKLTVRNSRPQRDDKAGVVEVCAIITGPDGRETEEYGYCACIDHQGKPLTGQRYGDAVMHAITKARRRAVATHTGFAAPAEYDTGRVVEGFVRELDNAELAQPEPAGELPEPGPETVDMAAVNEAADEAEIDVQEMLGVDFSTLTTPDDFNNTVLMIEMHKGKPGLSEARDALGKAARAQGLAWDKDRREFYPVPLMH